MNECIVEGCNIKAERHVGSKDEYGFCRDHREAWGYFRVGYYRGRGFERDGLLRKKVWNEAMRAFLEHCRIEIVACTQIAESVLRSANDRHI